MNNEFDEKAIGGQSNDDFEKMVEAELQRSKDNPSLYASRNNRIKPSVELVTTNDPEQENSFLVTKPKVAEVVVAKPVLNKPQVQKEKPDKPKTQANQEVDADYEEEGGNLTNEEVEAAIGERFGNEVVELMNDSKWENRRDAFSQMISILQGNPTNFNNIVDVILKYIKIKLKDYKENNVNILKEALNLIQTICENCKNFAKKHCVIIIKKTCEKFGENKLKTNISTLFLQFMEYHTPKYIMNILLKHMTNVVKGPNVLKEFAMFIEKSIEEFGINLHPVKEVVEFAKYLANHTNPQLRSAATTLLCCIYKYIGPKIKSFLNDIKEATMKVIDKEFENVAIVTEVETKRVLKGEAADTQTGGNLMESLFPRVDISRKVTGELLKQFIEGNWQVKKKVIEDLERILKEANNRILPNGLGDLVTTLKNKLNDGNKNLVRLMVQFIMKLVDSLGPECKQFSKTLIGPVLNNLSDKMNLLRDDVIKCLEKWAELIGFENVLSHCPAIMGMENFELRNDLLKLIVKNKASLANFDCKEIIPGILSCLLDKSPIIRNLAEELVKETAKIVTISNFYNVLNGGSYKPAFVQTIKPIIDKYSSTIIDTDQMQVDSEIKQQEKLKEKQVTKSVPANNKKREGNNNSTSNDKKKKNNNGGTAKPQQPQQPQPMPNIKKVTIGNPNDNNMQVIDTPVIQKTLLISNNIKINQKKKRIELEKSLAFPNEFITQLYINNLKTTMSTYFNKPMLDNAFSTDITKVDAFFTSLKTSVQNDSVIILEVMDMILKYILIKNLEFNSNHFYNNMVFEVMKSIAELLIDCECHLSELENKFILELLVIKIFSINPQLTTKYKQLIFEFSKVIKFDYLIDYFIGKFCTILDEEIRIQLIDLLKGVYMANKALPLDDPNKIRLLFNVMTSYTKDTNPSERNSRMIILSLINEICARNDQAVFSIVAEYRDYIPMLPNYKQIQSEAAEDHYIKSHKNVVHLSRSPILKTEREKENSSKDSFKPDDLIDQNKIDSILERLYGPDLNKKVQALLDINDIVTNKFKDNSELLLANINNLLIGLKELLRHIFLQPSLDDTILELLKYLLLPFYRIALTKELIEGIDINLIYEVFQEILKAILFDNLENIGSQEEGKKAIKSLNAIIMKLLENFNYTDSIIALIKLLENFRSEQTKVCSLVIKCLLKMVNTLSNIVDSVDLHKVLACIYEYLVEFEKIRPDLSTTNANEDNSMRVLRTLLTEIVKLKNDTIWDIYKTVIEDSNLQDRHLKKWIQVIIRSKNGISMPNSTVSVSGALNTLKLDNNVIPTESSEEAPAIKELNYFIQKLQITTATEKKALYLDILTYVKKNKLGLEYLKDKLTDLDYSQITSINDVEFKVGYSLILGKYKR
jgi:cytoskeleton-associated protein 5